MTLTFVGFAFGDFTIARNAAALLLVNVLALDVIGSMLIFLLRGIRKEYFSLEHTLRQIAEAALEEISMLVHENSIVDVTLQNESQAEVFITLRGAIDSIPNDLAQSIFQEIFNQTECRANVIIELSPCQVFLDS